MKDAGRREKRVQDHSTKMHFRPWRAHYSNPARLHSLIMIGWPRPQRGELFLGEAINRPLMGRAVDAQIGDLHGPTLKPIVEVFPRSEAPAREGVAFYILDAVFDLALGACSI